MFQNAHCLLYFIFVAVFAVIFLISFKMRVKDYRKFAPDETLKTISSFDHKKYLIRGLFLVLALVCIVLALSRPKWGIKQTENKLVSSDIVIALDVSKSMNARDLKPDRLTRATMVFTDLIREIPGQRAGLIAFAGKAFWQCPRTSDLNALAMFLDIIDTDAVPFEGTNIAAAIDLSAQSLKSTPKGAKALVIITDGEILEGDIDEALKNAAAQGMIIFTVGIGTEEGAPIPIYENGVFKEFIKDSAGNTVISRLDEITLERIAKQTGGKYFNLNKNPDISGLAVYLNNLDKIEGNTVAFNNLKDRFYYPLAFAVFFLLLFFFTPDVKIFRILAVFTVLILLPCSSAVADSMADGVEHYNKGDFAGALEIFKSNEEKNPNNPKINYNLASAYYKNNDYEKALKHFQKALDNTDDEVFKSVLAYNMGNAAFRTGNKEMAENYFKSSLNFNPSNFNAKHNLEFLLNESSNGQSKENKQDDNGKKQPEQQPENKQQPENNKPEQKGKNLLNYLDEQDKENRKRQNRRQGVNRITNYW